MISDLEAIARSAANSAGIELYSVSQHPGGDWMLFTSEGKKYLAQDTLAALEDDDLTGLAAAVFAVLAPGLHAPSREETLAQFPALSPSEEEFNAPRAEPGIHQALEEAILVNAEAFEAECRAAAVVAEEKVALTSDTNHESPKAKRGRKAKTDSEETK